VEASVATVALRTLIAKAFVVVPIHVASVATSLVLRCTNVALLQSPILPLHLLPNQLPSQLLSLGTTSQTMANAANVVLRTLIARRAASTHVTSVATSQVLRCTDVALLPSLNPLQLLSLLLSLGTTSQTEANAATVVRRIRIAKRVASIHVASVDSMLGLKCINVAMLQNQREEWELQSRNTIK